ncbi:hypothetical protein IQA86_18880 [Leptospira borgpetersenii serovar Balcanica]|uniref:hypothetical protein n=1 Tax=Leptospira borgpetersenii TaxID=174 RepID=UPI001880BD82|nr:hypothetical protein [Leptospira borgpetersenii serovar Balcanica]
MGVEEAEFCMNRVMKREVSKVLLSSFVTARRAKGESVDGLRGCTLALRTDALKPNTVVPVDLFDTCGTGGVCPRNRSSAFLFSFALASLCP